METYPSFMNFHERKTIFLFFFWFFYFGSEVYKWPYFLHFGRIIQCTRHFMNQKLTLETQIDYPTPSGQVANVHAWLNL